MSPNKRPHPPIINPSISLLWAPGNHPPTFFSVNLPVLDVSYKPDQTTYVPCDWPVSLRSFPRPSPAVHVPALSLSPRLSRVPPGGPCFVCHSSPGDGPSGGFHCLVVMSNAAVNIHVNDTLIIMFIHLILSFVAEIVRNSNYQYVFSESINTWNSK